MKYMTPMANSSSILYTDFHPRDGKQSGAWMNSIKEQYHEADGSDSRPQIIIVMNFTRPTETKPSLLTFDEVNTLLHEFGHAFARNVCRRKVRQPVRYKCISRLCRTAFTTNGKLADGKKEFLDLIAVHYETGEKIPQELIRKLVDASNFNTGYFCCRQLSFGMLDMAWHTQTEPFEEMSSPSKNRLGHGPLSCRKFQAHS